MRIWIRIRHRLSQVRSTVLRTLLSPTIKLRGSMAGQGTDLKSILVGRGDVLIVRINQDCNLRLPPGELVYLAKPIKKENEALFFMAFASFNNQPR